MDFSKRDTDGFEDAVLSPSPPLLTLEYKPEKTQKFYQQQPLISRNH